MPRRDLYHHVVVGALEREGWKITDDPLILSYGKKDLFVDLGAEQILGAVKGDRRIAVEIKSFISASDVFDLELAIGQYNVYRDVLAEVDPDRTIYLAVPLHAYENTFKDQLGQLVMKRQRLNIIVFGESPKEELQWIT